MRYVRACGHVYGRCVAGRCRRRRRTARASRPHRPRLVPPRLPRRRRPQCRRSAAAAPPRRAEIAGPGGRSAARTGCMGRRTVAAAASEGRAVAGSVGGTRGAHAARSAAAAAAARPPRERHWSCPRGCDLAGARWTPSGASGGSEAVPGGLDPAWRWSTVALGPAGAAAAALMRCQGRLMALCAHMRFFEIWRDFMYGNGHIHVHWRVASCFSINIRDVECKKPRVATFSCPPKNGLSRERLGGTWK